MVSQSSEVKAPLLEGTPFFRHPEALEVPQHATRSLLIRNLHRGISKERLLDELSLGKVQNVNTQHLRDEGFVVMDFYDLRDCVRAQRFISSLVLCSPSLCQPGMRLDVHFFMTKSEAAGTPFENEGKILVFGVGEDVPPADFQSLQGFGDIQQLRVTSRPFGVFTWIVEYFDLRAAELALSTLSERPLNGRQLKVTYLNGFSSWVSAGFYGTAIPESFPIPSKFMFSPPFESRSRSPSPTRSLSPDFGHEGFGFVPSPPSSPPFQALSPIHQHFHHPHGHPGNVPDTKHHHPHPRIPQNFHVDLDNIRRGLDRRTTLMIRNIPNKYTQDMFLDFINETHKGEYDFIYLPIDFKNKCNVGYAFINFIDPRSITSLYQRIQGKRWTRFNSEKICAVSYGRIQGKENLIKHFQNSTIMSECSDYRPKIFFSDGPHKGQEEIFPEPSQERFHFPDQQVPVYQPERRKSQPFPPLQSPAYHPYPFKAAEF